MNKLVAFEGVDGSGKSTQISRLLSKLSKKNIEYSVYREPGGDHLSEKIRELLLDKSMEIVDEAETMLFLAARAQLTKKGILPDLKKNKLVICDRFCDSTLVYQGYGKMMNKDIIRNCNMFVTGELKPSVTIIIDIDYNTSLKRMGKNKDRIEQNSRTFFENVIEGYKELAKDSPDRYFLVNGRSSEEEIHQLIWEKINKELYL